MAKLKRKDLIVVGGTAENPIFHEYRSLLAVTPINLALVAGFQKRCREAYDSQSHGGDIKQQLSQYAEIYVSILNYSQARSNANAGAMMMPVAFDSWTKLQFSDDTRMVFHAVMHGHYRSWASKQESDHVDQPEIMEWCRHLGITSHPQTIQKIINYAIADKMMVECDSGNNSTKGIAPTQTTIDMYESSSCMYVALVGDTWTGIKDREIIDDIAAITDGRGIFLDLAVINLGLRDEFKRNGFDYESFGVSLPRLT
tara:strand:- start:304 stop:1071 length:768 start_codon:yes stop_codon:yes gene_type:complete